MDPVGLGEFDQDLRADLARQEDSSDALSRAMYIWYLRELTRDLTIFSWNDLYSSYRNLHFRASCRYRGSPPTLVSPIE